MADSQLCETRWMSLQFLKKMEAAGYEDASIVVIWKHPGCPAVWHEAYRKPPTNFWEVRIPTDLYVELGRLGFEFTESWITLRVSRGLITRRRQRYRDVHQQEDR